MFFKIIEEFKGMRKVMLLSALFFGAVAFFNSCKKTGDLTPPFSEGALSASYTDTNTVNSVTLSDDSTRTDNTSRNLFGMLNDPVFGITKASFYAQFKLSTTALTFPPGATTDSVVLYLAYDELYGSPKTMTAQVYEITEALSTDNQYYNYSTATINSTPLGTQEFLPDVTESDEDTSEFDPHISIVLDSKVGQQIIDHGTFASNDDFVDFFKGLNIAPDTSVLPAFEEGTIVYFNLLSTTTRMVIYYHYPGEGSQVQTGEYKMVLSSGSPRFSHYEHNYKGTDIELNIGKNDVPLNYVQPMSGVKTKITFPHIQNMTKERNITVNKADLLITVAEGSSNFFAAPSRLILLTKDEDGNDVFIPDFFEGTDYFGGKLDVNSNTYRFNIARYIDQLVNEKQEDKGLYLIVSGTAVNAGRLILNSGSASPDNLKLRLTYTQL